MPSGGVGRGWGRGRGPGGGYLAGGEPPRLAEHLLEERRLDLEVLGDDVEAEEVAVDAAAGHRRPVAVLVRLGRRVQQADALLVLRRPDLDSRTVQRDPTSIYTQCDSTSFRTQRDPTSIHAP